MQTSATSPVSRIIPNLERRPISRSDAPPAYGYAQVDAATRVGSAQRTCAANGIARDMGVLDLAIHDIFTPAKDGQNADNYRLDLSTLFEGGDPTNGGHPSNSRNPLVYSTARAYYELFLRAKERIAKKHPELPEAEVVQKARASTVRQFNRDVYRALLNVTGMRVFAEANPSPITVQELAGARMLHVIAPSQLAELDLLDPANVKVPLQPHHFAAPLTRFRGGYDLRLRQIPAGPGQFVDLQEVDRKFIEDVAKLDQKSMLAEMAAVGQDKIRFGATSTGKLVHDLFSKALI